jgi:magnesium chelatase family protein
VFPTRFMLVAATNPCPCGFVGDARCDCGAAELARHARRLSGPLLDRIDIVVDLQRPSAEALAGEPVTDSDTVRAVVVAARDRQEHRLRGTGASCNAQMDAALVRRHARPDAAGRLALADAYARTGLSARGHERILKVARTFADLEGVERVTAAHISAAMSMRQERGAGRDELAA